MRLDLDRIGLKGQAQAQRFGRLDDLPAEGFPVEVGPGAQVGVVVADGAVHLAHELDGRNALARAGQAHDHVAQFLADGGRARGLAVGAAEHGHVGELVRHLAQAGDHLVQRGQQHGVAPALELQGVAGVVDVLAGAGEVHELRGLFQFGACVELGLDPVLHGLDVVVGGLLDLLDGHGIGLGEVLDQAHQVGAGTGRERWELLETSVGQGDEPRDLDLHAAVHVALFAHERAQRRQLAGVAAVQRREGGDGGEAAGGSGGGGRGRSHPRIVEGGSGARPIPPGWRRRRWRSLKWLAQGPPQLHSS